VSLYLIRLGWYLVWIGDVMDYCPQADVIRTRRRLVLALIIRYNVSQ
jgi:hypothetical protein